MSKSKQHYKADLSVNWCICGMNISKILVYTRDKHSNLNLYHLYCGNVEGINRFDHSNKCFI